MYVNHALGINLFKDSVEEVNSKLVNTTWKSNRTGENFTVAKVYVNSWEGSYQAQMTDGSIARITELFNNAQLQRS